MYRPRKAREDTVLFPAFSALMPPGEFAALGEQFEDKEHEVVGEGGFKGVVQRIQRLEQSLGIADLAHFTPPER
jgi:hypothetical protein